MYSAIVLFVLFIFSNGYAAYIPQSEDVYEISNDTKTVQRDRNTRLVMFGMRHGNRNPTQFLKEVTGDWGLEGDLELTPVIKFVIKSFKNNFSLVRDKVMLLVENLENILKVILVQTICHLKPNFIAVAQIDAK